MTTCAPEDRDSLPDSAAVFLLRTGPGEPYISRTKHLRTRVARLLDPAALATKRVSLAGRITAIEYWPVHSDFEARWMQYQVLRREFPQDYRRKLRLRGAPLIRLGRKNRFPRAALTRRSGRLDGASRYYGPYPSRKHAADALRAALDLFQVRRCIENLAPHAAHPGCIYGEMKMCLAPCQIKVADEDYLREVARLQSFLDTSAESLLDELSAERERLASSLAFEEAAALHARWQKVKDASRLIPDIVRPLDQWNAALLMPGANDTSPKLFRIRQGVIGGPVEIDVAAARAAGSKALAQAISEALDSIPVAESGSLTRAEHLFLLQRWFYRSTKRRVGELVQSDAAGRISLRKLSAAAERLLARDAAAEQPASPSSSGAPASQ